MPDEPFGPDVRGTGPPDGGETAGAPAVLREADQARAAWFTRDHLLEEQADGRGAIAAFQRAVRRGQAAPRFVLGDLLAESDDPRGLMKAYRVAAERGDQGAAYQLGLLYLDRGDLRSAKAAFATADKLGHAWAAFALGEILDQTGDRGGAVAAYRRAAHRRVTAAHARLEELLARTGGAGEPIAAYPLTDEAGPAGSTKRLGLTNKRLARAAVAVALAAILVIALLILVPNSGPKRAAAPPSTRARSGGAQRGGGLPALGSPTADFTAKQSALLDSVPGTAHAECLPGAQKPLPRSAASIRCFSSAAGITVLYYRYSSLPVLRSLFHNYRAWFAARHKLRDCAGLTHGTYSQGGAGSTITGRWACFYNDRTIPPSACIDWVDYGLLTFGSACQADENFTALERWWRNAGPVPASTAGLTNRL